MKYSKFMSLRINQILKQNKLYEGLIQTYSIDDTIRYFVNNILKLTEETNKNKAISYIRIIFYKVSINKDILSDKYLYINENELYNKIKSWMNLCGWYCADLINSFNERIPLTQEHNNIRYIIFRAKYDREINRKEWPTYLYHITYKKI